MLFNYRFVLKIYFEYIVLNCASVNLINVISLRKFKNYSERENVINSKELKWKNTVRKTFLLDFFRMFTAIKTYENEEKLIITFLKHHKRII